MTKYILPLLDKLFNDKYAKKYTTMALSLSLIVGKLELRNSRAGHALLFSRHRNIREGDIQSLS